MTRRAKPLLVGEDNPHSSDPAMALHVDFVDGAGSRLAGILGLSVDEYLSRFRRANLCRRGWDRREALREAEHLVTVVDPTFVVLLGRKVCDAFGVPFEPFTVKTGALATYAVLPHPSGRCRTWNDAGNAARARACVAAGDRAARARRVPGTRARRAARVA